MLFFAYSVSNKRYCLVCVIHTFLCFQACTTFSNSYQGFFFSLAAGRLPVQSIIWLLLPSLTVSENTVKPQSSQIDFHSQLVFTFEIVQSAACLWGCQECTLFNLETPDKSQADWTATPSNSNRIKLRSIKWTAQDSVIQACLCYCKRKVTSVIQEKVKLPKWKKKAFL